MDQPTVDREPREKSQEERDNTLLFEAGLHEKLADSVSFGSPVESQDCKVCITVGDSHTVTSQDALSSSQLQMELVFFYPIPEGESKEVFDIDYYNGRLRNRNPRHASVDLDKSSLLHMALTDIIDRKHKLLPRYANR